MAGDPFVPNSFDVVLAPGKSIKVSITASNDFLIDGVSYLAAIKAAADGTGGGAVTSVAGRTGVVVLAVADINSAVLTALNTVMSSTATAAAQRTALGLGTAATQNLPNWHDDGNSGSTLTVDLSVANAQKITLTASCTFTFSNPTAGGVYVLQLLQGGSGSFTVTWPGTVKWSGGTAPTLTTTAGKVDLITFYYDGTDFFGVASGLNYTP